MRLSRLNIRQKTYFIFITFQGNYSNLLSKCQSIKITKTKLKLKKKTKE